MAVSVVVAVGEVDLIAKIAERMPQVTVGDGTAPGIEMGPLITRDALERVTGSSPAPKARVRASSSTANSTCRRAGSSSALARRRRDPGMRVYDEEIFGPVLSVVRVASYDDAVALINDNRYATARPSSPATARRRGSSSSTSRSAWSASTCRSGADRRVLVRRLEGLALRRHAHVRAGSVPLLHAPQGRHDPVARPSESQISLGFPTH
jgi:hypothetical protein